MKRSIILLLCITHCATAMGQNWLTTLLRCCLPAQHPQQAGIQIEVKLYREGHENPVSSDSRFYYPDASNYYVPAYDPIEMTNFHADNRVTLDQPTIIDANNPVTIKFNTRIGNPGSPTDTQSLPVDIDKPPKKVNFENSPFYVLLSASKATRDTQ